MQGAGGAGASGRKRSRTGSVVGAAGGNGSGNGVDKDGSDRIDGRAGPKSENVVLQKTIDHIRSQLDERQRLKMRLERAKTTLPPSHPLHDSCRFPANGAEGGGGNYVPPWERPWYGGKNDEEGGSDEEA